MFGAPFTLVKLPPTIRSPFGAAASVNTVPSSCGRNVEIHVPVDTSKAASHGWLYCGPPAPFCTAANFPPTNIVLPTCASACAGASLSGSGSAIFCTPTTPHWNVCGLLCGSHDSVCAAVPEAGTAVKPAMASSISGGSTPRANGTAPLPLALDVAGARYEEGLLLPPIWLPKAKPIVCLWLLSRIERLKALSKPVFCVVALFADVLCEPNEYDASISPPANSHVHPAVFVRFHRISCQLVPAELVARMDADAVGERVGSGAGEETVHNFVGQRGGRGTRLRR